MAFRVSIVHKVRANCALSWQPTYQRCSPAISHYCEFDKISSERSESVVLYLHE